MLIFSMQAYASGMEDDPIVTKVMVEVESSNDSQQTWNLAAWAGKDLQKIWIKSEGEKEEGKIQEAELQLLYSQAISPFWDFQYGIKRDFKPTPTRDWLVVAAQGLTPYLFELEASLFVGESGRAAVRLDAEYEYMLTQKLVLSPEIEFNIFAKDDAAVGTGKGLANIEAGIKLQYEVMREFAPYIGVNWGKKYSNTAKFASNEGEDIEDTQVVLGLRFWF